MSDFDKALDWLEEHTEEVAKGFDAIVEKMYSELRDVPDRVAMVRLLQREGKKHLGELGDELSLSRQLVAYHEKALERIGVLSSKLDKAPKDYPAVAVRYVELTSLGERMLAYLESEVLRTSNQTTKEGET